MPSATQADAPAGAVTGWSLPWRRSRPLGEPRGWTADGAEATLAAWGSPSEALESLFGARPGRWLRRIPGRETFVWPDADGPTVVKRFLGDDPAQAWSDRLRCRPARSPGRREGECLLALAADGLPVPRALGWWEEPNPGGGTARAFARSAVAMERVPHSETLREVCRSRPSEATRLWLVALAGLVARLHAGGWYHRDLYLQHVVLAQDQDSGERLVLLDVGRARREASPRRRWLVKDLAALLHSTPDGVGPRARLRFLCLYARARGLARRERRRLARDVLAKARRIAAHRPRHVDPDEARRGGVG